MKHKHIWFLSCFFVLGIASLVWADDPTSRFLQLSKLASSLPASSSGQTVQFEVWDDATAGTMIFAESHTVDTDAGSNISNDTGLTDLLLGRGTVGGLVPAKFPAGSTRYLDVTQSGVTVLAARVPLYASVFSVSAPNEVPGNLTLVDSTADSGNILKNGALFLHNFGTGNSFLGQSAGNLSMTGQYNTGMGANALQSNTSGTQNTATGTAALQFNTTGAYNTSNGEEALRFNTTGNYNSASGFQALYINTTGSWNTASGAQALKSNTTGGSNTASGFNALQNNTTASNNTAMGANALQNNTLGEGNTASGAGALFSNTSGGANTASGWNALTTNTTGVENTATGAYALASTTSGAYNTGTGDGALGHNTTGSSNTASGTQVLLNNTTGNENSASGFNALFSNTTGSDNTAMGYGADVSVGNLTNATAIGYNAIVNASNKIRLGNTSVSVIEGQVAYTFTSDKNQKENFQPVNAEDVLTKLAQLPVSTWNYIGHDPRKFRHYGPVAQEFFDAFGHDGVGTVGTDTTINSGDMEGILMIAVQALERRTAELATLKAENADLKARLERLERSIGTLVVKAE